MKVALKLPRIGMNMEEGTLVAWRVQPGESFKEGDILYDVETEKVTSEYEAPCNGKMLEHFADEGDDVPVGDNVCRIETGD
ncbi:MAG: lipoyl domain-containing protein [Paracoccaceae bacterium]|nr:lipoyl domain-containing protein [Paracoccaceae bacterium]MDE2914015.1 lipoyl domain-containing protein [Paracoccaceae bacterium]